MTDEERDERLAHLLDVRAGRAERDADTDPGGAELENLLEVADLLWEAAHGAPPLEDDPAAAMLGLVPDETRSLDGKALARARKAAGLKQSELATRLITRGWSIKQADLFGWETKRASAVAPALIKAVADELGVAMDRLMIVRSFEGEHERFASVTESPRFAAIVERWMRIQAVPRELAVSALESRMLLAVHRGDRPDTDQLLRSLEALTSALEGDDHNGGNV